MTSSRTTSVAGVAARSAVLVAALFGAALVATAPVAAAPQPFSVEFAPESRSCCYHRPGNDDNTPDDTPLMRGVTVAGSELTFDLLGPDDEVILALGSTTAGSDGRFRFQYPQLENGPLRVRATVWEPEAQRRRKYLLSFTVDTVPPATPPGVFALGPKLKQPAPAEVTTDALEVVFTFRPSEEPDAGPLMLFRDGEAVRPQWVIDERSVRVQLPENETHVYRMAHVDWAGNVGPFSKPITVTQEILRTAVDTVDVKSLRRSEGLTILRATPRKPYSLGQLASAAGDFNGDGADDVAIAARESYLAVVYGGQRKNLADVVDVASLDGRNGMRIVSDVEHVAGGGDFNGDGIDDLVLGGGDGHVRVVFGAADSRKLVTLDEPNKRLGLIVEHRWSSDSFAFVVEGFGQTVAMLGDVNGDGVADIGIGARGQIYQCCTEDHRRPGLAFVVFGRRDGRFPAVLNVKNLNGENGFRIDGAAKSDLVGELVAAAGDVNGDGLADFLVGAPGAKPDGRKAAGTLYVVFGSRKAFPRRLALGKLDGRDGFAIPGVLPGDRLGRKQWGLASAAGAGDVNGDGVDDIVLTAEDENAARTAFVVFGHKSKKAPRWFDLKALDGSNGFRARISSGEVAGVGDTNGDGIDDVMFGGGSEPLSGYLLLGQRKRFPKLVEFDRTNEVAAVRITGLDSPSPVSAAGDLDDDGRDDILLGAPKLKDDLPDGGGYVLFGQEWKK
jgi:hypothetical protein